MSPVLSAEEEVAVSAKVPDKNKDAIASIIKGYEEDYNRIRLSILPEKDLPKRMTRFRKELPKPAEAIDQIIQLAKENPQVEGVKKGLLWALKKTLSSKNKASSVQRKQMTDLFLTHYKDSEAMLDLALYYAKPVPGDQESIDALRRISETATRQEIAIEAAYYVANRLMRDEATKPEGLAAMQKLAETLDLEKIAPAILAQAKGEILEAQQLQVGKVAADIIGTDHEDKKFKLSDYRGKVVLVHFWATW